MTATCSYASSGAAIARAEVLARCRGESVYVVLEGSTYAVADEADLDTFYMGAPVIGEVMSDGTFVASD